MTPTKWGYKIIQNVIYYKICWNFVNKLSPPSPTEATCSIAFLIYEACCCWHSVLDFFTLCLLTKAQPDVKCGGESVYSTVCWLITPSLVILPRHLCPTFSEQYTFHFVSSRWYLRKHNVRDLTKQLLDNPAFNTAEVVGKFANSSHRSQSANWTSTEVTVITFPKVWYDVSLSRRARYTFCSYSPFQTLM